MRCARLMSKESTTATRFFSIDFDVNCERNLPHINAIVVFTLSGRTSRLSTTLIVTERMYRNDREGERERKGNRSSVRQHRAAQSI